jgi:hypothetical protein
MFSNKGIEHRIEYMKTEACCPRRVVFNLREDGLEEFVELGTKGWVPFTPSCEERLFAHQLFNSSTTQLLPVGTRITLRGVENLMIDWAQ